MIDLLQQLALANASLSLFLQLYLAFRYYSVRDYSEI